MCVPRLRKSLRSSLVLTTLQQEFSSLKSPGRVP